MQTITRLNIDFNKIQVEVDAGYINVQYHPTNDLRIYNYTAKAQFDHYWTDEVKACRGLIVNGENRIVARPFAKFFNYEQVLEQIPNEPFEAYEKLDGSLGILYFGNDNEPYIATRGSFTSEQAQRANRILKEKYAHIEFDACFTYLFEIIYPQNRIVVDYGSIEDLFLLAIIDTKTGLDVPLQDIGMPIVQRFDGISDLSLIRAREESNKEGFVIKFTSGFRVKIKFDEYKRLHKLLTGVNARHIWEVLRDGQSLEPLIERVPDEYYNWVKETERILRIEFEEIETYCKHDFKDLGDRKENALYYKTCLYPAILFSMLDGKDYSHLIWKLIRPQASTAFRCDIDL